MSIENLFEAATKGKFRFQFKGLISTEDIFDLSVENLDSIFKGLNSQMKQVDEESLLNIKTKADKELNTKIEIVKYIVNMKLEEKDLKSKEVAKREQKQKLLGILSNKQNEELNNKSPEELIKMINELD